MAERRAKGWATMAIAGIGVAAIVSGLIMAGGPAQGRAEQRDQRRERDLSRLVNHLQCLSREAGSLVAQAGATEACPLPENLVDPESGAAYRVEQIDDENLRVCADFETEAARDRIRAYSYRTTDLIDDAGCRVAFFPNIGRDRDG